MKCGQNESDCGNPDCKECNPKEILDGLVIKLKQLLDDPQPGLHTWQVHVKEIGIEIQKTTEYL